MVLHERQAPRGRRRTEEESGHPPVQAAKADAVTIVGRVAMHDVAMLSQLEQQLSQVVPIAVTRLQAIGDMASLGLAEIVSDTVRQLSR